MTTLKTSVWQTTDDATYFQIGHCPWQLHSNASLLSKFTICKTLILWGRGGGGGGAFDSFHENLNRPALKSSILPGLRPRI